MSDARLSPSLQFLAGEEQAAAAKLIEAIALKPISNEPGFEEGIQAKAKWCLEQLKAAGVSLVDLVHVPDDAGGVHNPIVLGRDLRAGPQRPTLIVYAHYDVQSGGDGWTVTEPFSAKLINGKFYGRGVGDNTGPLVSIIQAIRACILGGGSCPVNLIVIFEGEEEAGGGGVEKFVQNPAKYGFHDLFANAKAVLVCDTEMADADRPGIEWGLRGLMYYVVTVRGLTRDAHSGLEGGKILDPNLALALMLASTYDPLTGDITIPGFADSIIPLNDRERALLAAYPTDPDSFGAPGILRYPHCSLAEQIGTRPTLTVHAMCGGFISNNTIADGSYTKIFGKPALAKCSNRLVAGQDPKLAMKALVDHLNSFAKGPLQGTVTVEVQPMKLSEAIRFDPSGKAIELAAAAMGETWQAEPGLGCGGGSIPIVGTFKRALGIDLVLIGATDRNCGMHSENEFLSERNFHNLARAIVRYLYSFGEAIPA